MFMKCTNPKVIYFRNVLVRYAAHQLLFGQQMFSFQSKAQFIDVHQQTEPALCHTAGLHKPLINPRTQNTYGFNYNSHRKV